MNENETVVTKEFQFELSPDVVSCLKSFLDYSGLAVGSDDNPVTSSIESAILLFVTRKLRVLPDDVISDTEMSELRDSWPCRDRYSLRRRNLACLLSAKIAIYRRRVPNWLAVGESEFVTVDLNGGRV